MAEAEESRTGHVDWHESKSVVIFRLSQAVDVSDTRRTIIEKHLVIAPPERLRPVNTIMYCVKGVSEKTFFGCEKRENGCGTGESPCFLFVGFRLSACQRRGARPAAGPFRVALLY